MVREQVDLASAKDDKAIERILLYFNLYSIVFEIIARIVVVLFIDQLVLTVSSIIRPEDACISPWPFLKYFTFDSYGIRLDGAVHVHKDKQDQDRTTIGRNHDLMFMPGQSGYHVNSESRTPLRIRQQTGLFAI